MTNGYLVAALKSKEDAFEFRDAFDWEAAITYFAVCLLGGSFILIFDELGALGVTVSLLIIAALCVAMFLGGVQRLVVNAVGFRPSMTRLTLIRRHATRVGWDSVKALWPVEATNLETGKFWLTGFDVDAGTKGKLTLRVARGVNRIGRAQALDRAVRGIMRDSISVRWREIPELESGDLDLMRLALSSDPRKAAMKTGLAALPLLATLVTIQGYAELGGYTPSSPSEAWNFLLAVMTIAIILFFLYIAVLLIGQRRAIRYSGAIGMYAQIRRHEERSGTKVIPQMRVIECFRGIEPNPPPIETWRAGEFLRSLNRNLVRSAVGIVVAFGVPMTWISVASAFNWPAIASIWTFAFPFILLYYSIDGYLKADENVRRLRQVVHEEWKANRRFFTGGRFLWLWGIHRDPVALLQRNLSRLRARKEHPWREDILLTGVVIALLVTFLASITVLTGMVALAVFVATTIALFMLVFYLALRKSSAGPDVAVRAAVEYEQVTGRCILPLDIGSSADANPKVEPGRGKSDG